MKLEMAGTWGKQSRGISAAWPNTPQARGRIMRHRRPFKFRENETFVASREACDFFVSEWVCYHILYSGMICIHFVVDVINEHHIVCLFVLLCLFFQSSFEVYSEMAHSPKSARRVPYNNVTFFHPVWSLLLTSEIILGMLAYFKVCSKTFT